MAREEAAAREVQRLVVEVIDLEDVEEEAIVGESMAVKGRRMRHSTSLPTTTISFAET